MRALLCFVVLFSPLLAQAQTLQEFLRAFHAHPRETMQLLPPYIENGEMVARGRIDSAKVETLLRERNKLRSQIAGAKNWENIGFSTDPSKSAPENLVEPGPIIRSLVEMESQKLTSTILPQLPWPDSYWPMYKGLIAIRYADPSFPDSKDWETNYSYSQRHSPLEILSSGNSRTIDRLSAAEKYDIAMGDLSFGLSNYAWGEGKRFHDRGDRVATWMGICHGWAGAAHMNSSLLDAPVTVHSPAGVPITFHPQDVKALQSMLWAKGSPNARFLGNRCDVSRPERDEYGRVKDAKCFDSNPGTWHIAVVNQMAVHQRSFVMDSTFDAEVWNFPLASYQYAYFNPESWEESRTLRGAMIPIEKFRVDKFRAYRDPATRYVVGVYMDVSYVNAIVPTRGVVRDSHLKTVRFIYDLELDADRNVIGGEWYSNAHPDFLWTFPREAQARANGEERLEPWAATQAVPSSWQALAARASLRGLPLRSFIAGLTQKLAPPSEPEEPPVEPPLEPGEDETDEGNDPELP